MGWQLWRFGLGLVLLGGVVTGCHRQAVHSKPPPPDPLLISKKPIEGNPAAARDATVRIEPPAPPAPGGDQWATSPVRETVPTARSVKVP
jgi:hypothetical protein